MEDPNPVDHDLATVVRRYLGIRMAKARTKLGGSDWSHTDLSPAHYVYMAEDVGYLPALWTVLEQALREAQLDAPLRERMKFLPHLNQIKMTGIPIDVGQGDADCQRVSMEKATVREELRAIFSDYRHPIPKSRLKTIKIKAENGRFQRVPGPTHEEFSPSNRGHVLGALTQRGLLVQNTQEATLKKFDAPECRLLLKYTAVKKRFEAIKGITRSTFCDGRVRAAGWNQLSARTGRITSTEPNLQQVPRTGAPDFGWSRRSFGSKAISRRSRWSLSQLSTTLPTTDFVVGPIIRPGIGTLVVVRPAVTVTASVSVAAVVRPAVTVTASVSVAAVASVVSDDNWWQ